MNVRWTTRTLGALIPPAPTVMLWLTLASLAGMTPQSTDAQEPLPADSIPCEDDVAPTPGAILDRYVDEGLRANLALRQTGFVVDQATARVDEARSAFLPGFTFDARFSKADGGRSFDIPVGDLLNPVYNTLNDFAAQQGQVGGFPTIPNEEIRFLRGTEQDTRLRVTQTLFNPRAWNDLKSSRSAEASEVAGQAAFRRATIRDIKVAYFRYVNAQRSVEILEDAYAHVAENERVSERLVDASLATPDRVYRARAERLTVEQQQAQAQVNAELARSNFNFFLNRDPRAAIDIDRALIAQPMWRNRRVRRTAAGPASNFEGFIDSLTAVAVDTRDEMRQLEAAAEAAEYGVSAARGSALPSVVLALDGGIQGVDYGFGAEQRYLMGSVILQWDVFSGGGNRARAQRASAEAGRLRVRKEELERQIRLEVETAARNAGVALSSLDTAEQRVEEATRTFRLVSRRRDEGLATPLEFLDARAALTRAELNLSITQNQFMIRLAELDFAAGPWTSDIDAEQDR